MQVAFNMAPMNQRALSLPLSEIDLFIVNETEGAALTGERDAERILDSVASNYPSAQVALTLGDQGAWYQSRSARSFAPAARLPCSTLPAREIPSRAFSSLDYWQWTRQLTHFIGPVLQRPLAWSARGRQRPSRVFRKYWKGLRLTLNSSKRSRSRPRWLRHLIQSQSATSSKPILSINHSL